MIPGKPDIHNNTTREVFLAREEQSPLSSTYSENKGEYHLSKRGFELNDYQEMWKAVKLQNKFLKRRKGNVVFISSISSILHEERQEKSVKGMIISSTVIIV